MILLGVRGSRLAFVPPPYESNCPPLLGVCNAAVYRPLLDCSRIFENRLERRISVAARRRGVYPVLRRWSSDREPITAARHEMFIAGSTDSGIAAAAVRINT